MSQQRFLPVLPTREKTRDLKLIVGRVSFDACMCILLKGRLCDCDRLIFQNICAPQVESGFVRGGSYLRSRHDPNPNPINFIKQDTTTIQIRMGGQAILIPFYIPMFVIVPTERARRQTCRQKYIVTN